MSSELSTTESIVQRCRELGFALAGVCDAAPTAYADELRDWLARGRHGEMAYLQRNLEALLDPQRVLSGAQSVICVADRYHQGKGDPIEDRPEGRIARYARGDDYHHVIKRRLHRLCDELRRQFPNERFRACVDTAPLLEREYAQRAGLGAVGKHTLLIEPGVGSYVLLGEILTTLELAPSPAEQRDPCGACTRCIDACPTDAIEPWSVDATRCISYLTIEHRTAIDSSWHEPTGDWLFGCDICQEVCPHNQPTQRSRAAPVHEAYAPRRTAFDVLDVLRWDEAARREAFTHSSMKRARLTMMKRNAIIVAGNLLRQRPDAVISARLRELAVDVDEDELVRRTAREVLDRLDGGV